MSVSTPPDLGPRYQYLREIAEGGTSRVYLVRDTHLQKEVALKVLFRPPASAEEADQVASEFALLSRLEHPGIARAHDFGFLGELPYFTSEYVPGESLDRTLERCGGGLDPEALLKVALEVTGAVAFLHRQQVLHLDVKPGNIVLAREPLAARAVLVDFGLCRRGSTAAAQTKLQGSLPYMAPEYFQDGPLGPWTDVYALGVTLYQLATGRLPLRAVESSGCSTRIAAPAPSRLRTGLPVDLDHVLLRCLAQDPGARFPSAVEMLISLGRFAGAPAASKPSAGAGLTVGRTAEITVATRFLDRVLARESQAPALLVTAQSGMGQSHFLREVKLEAQTRGLNCYLETGYPGLHQPPGFLLRCLLAHMEVNRGRARWRAFLSRLRRPRQPARLLDASEGERRLRRASELARALDAVSQPLVLITDGLQYADEVSLALLIDLIRITGAEHGGKRPSISVVAGYREEGPLVSLLGELTAAILDSGLGESLSLGPLNLEETLELYRQFSAQAGTARPARSARSVGGLRVFQESGGAPARIMALASRGAAEEDLPAAAAVSGSSPVTLPLSRAEDDGLLALNLLERPATVSDLAAVVGLRQPQASRAVRKLTALGLCVESEPLAGRSAWLASPAGRSAAERASPARRRRLHRAIGGTLARGSPDDARLVEAVRHLRLAGARTSLVRFGPRAARYLVSTQQNRAALEVFRATLEALPARSVTARVKMTLETADLQGRVGEIDEGISLLRDLLGQPRTLPAADRLRLLFRLAVLHGRRGDFQRADALLGEGTEEALKPRTRLGCDEILAFLNESAAIKGFLGKPAEALRLCNEGLSLAGANRARRVREVVLNLHATRANVALRRFDFPEAARSFERALEIAEAIGSPVNQAVVLNNLGIVYSQCDRYDDAVRAFREAERSCLRLDEGPSLASVYGNLAVVHAKRGEVDLAADVLGRAEELRSTALGQRQELFLRHARGLVELHRGRHGDAIRHFEAAIHLADAMGDEHVAAFDRLWLAEALVFSGAYAAASRALGDLCTGAPPRIRAMALARRACLSALTAQPDAARDADRAYAEAPPSPPIPFLDAWDQVFLGWARSLVGDTESAWSILRPAEDFFHKHGLPPAASLARWVQAEGLFLSGRTDSARDLVPPRTMRGSDVTDVLWPLLEARLLLQDEPPAPARSAALDLLARAGTALVANRLPEWEVRLAALRGILSGEGREAVAAVQRQRRQLAQDLPAAVQKRYLHSTHWKAWTGVSLARGDAAAQLVEPQSARTAPIARKGLSAARARLVVRSPSMLRLSSMLDRLRDSELPILIRGETGSGKGLVAQAIHEESRRASGPFRVLECGATPAALVEAEVFGAEAGAFTGIDSRRRGLLELAAGGTVLLDDVADLPLEVQAKLLRALSDGTFRPLGAENELRADVRYLFATSRDLDGEVRDKRFRGDLLHRIHVISLVVPPLRERPEDLPALVAALLAEDNERAPPVIEGAAVEALRAWSWPGNVRELRNLLLRLRVESPGVVRAEDVERLVSAPAETTVFPRNLLAQPSLDSLRSRLERDYVLYHFRRLEGDTDALCRFLKLGRRQLYRRLEHAGISIRKERGRLNEVHRGESPTAPRGHRAREPMR